MLKKILTSIDKALPQDVFTEIVTNMEKETTLWGKISVLLP
ncbi:MAG TPA: hypothetical protein VJB70_00705 [Candidatus Paceibacterota bacterium]